MRQYKVYSYPYLSAFTKDYLHSEFTIKTVPGRQGKVLVFEIQYHLDNPKLSELVKEGKVQVVVKAVCSKLSFVIAKKIPSSESSAIFIINPMDVSDSLSFTAYLIAKEDFVYTNDDLSSEWKNMPTFVERNNSIGESNEEVVFIKHSGQKASKQSIFNFVARTVDNEVEVPVTMNLSEDRIIFVLPSKFKGIYDNIQKKAWQPILAGIVFPAVISILEQMKNVPSEDGDEPEPSKFSSSYCNKNWYQVIRSKFYSKYKSYPEEGNVDCFVAAQELFDWPIQGVMSYSNNLQNRLLQLNDGGMGDE